MTDYSDHTITELVELRDKFMADHEAAREAHEAKGGRRNDTHLDGAMKDSLERVRHIDNELYSRDEFNPEDWQ